MSKLLVIQTRVGKNEKRMIASAAKAAKRKLADWMRVVLIDAANANGEKR